VHALTHTHIANFLFRDRELDTGHLQLLDFGDAFASFDAAV
jgi:hypothetical protein